MFGIASLIIDGMRDKQSTAVPTQGKPKIAGKQVFWKIENQQRRIRPPPPSPSSFPAFPNSSTTRLNHALNPNLIVHPPYFHLPFPLFPLSPHPNFNPPTLQADLVPTIRTFLGVDGVGFKGVVALAACCLTVGVQGKVGDGWGGRHLKGVGG